MKKALKILSFVLVFALVLLPAVSLAANGPVTGIGADIKAGNSLIPTSWVNTALGALQVIGYIVAVIMILWLGIQWMLAQPAKKAELKGKMWSMAIGIALLVGGVTIINIIWDFANNNIK